MTKSTSQKHKTNAPARRGMYDRTGHGYEAARYGNTYKELYRQMRNEALADIIDNHFEKGALLRILEVGCGTGMTLEFLCDLPSNHEVYGVDFSLTMLSQAREKMKNRESSFGIAQGDAFKLPYAPGAFDVVYSTRFIHQFTHQQKKQLYQEMARILDAGGLIINEFYTRHSHWSQQVRGMRERPSVEQCPSLEDVRDIAGVPFTIRPVRMMGTRAVASLFGEEVLRRLTLLTNKPIFRMLAEEYFIVTVK